MKLWRDQEGNAQMIGMVIALMVSIIVGVMIWYKIAGPIMGGTGSTVAIRTLYNTTNTTASTVFTLFPIVGIVVIAGIILAIVTNFGRGQGA
jgi:hypothetical protein